MISIPFLSEGNGEAARIRGNRVRDLNKIQTKTYRQVEERVGQARAVPGHTIENPIAHAQPILVKGEQPSLFPSGGGLDRAKAANVPLSVP